jgi:hypothetical protein
MLVGGRVDASGAAVRGVLAGELWMPGRDDGAKARAEALGVAVVVAGPKGRAG